VLSPKIGLLVFPDVDLLDVVGYLEVVGFKIPQKFEPATYIITPESKAPDGSLLPIPTRQKVAIIPNTSIEDCPQLDVIFVPGGFGQIQMMENQKYLDFLKQQAVEAKYVTSVCTGALLLAAARLLDGYYATTHWNSIPCLKLFPEVKVVEGYPRFVLDGNRLTGGGVSSGIDAAIKMVSVLAGDEVAKLIQLLVQYNPQPMFEGGDPNYAEVHTLADGNAFMCAIQATRYQQIQKILGISHLRQ